MTIRETEYITGDAYYGWGEVFCSGGKHCCHKDGSIVFKDFKGYDREQLAPADIQGLIAQAVIHDRANPKHDIRVIVFGKNSYE
jgi:hypothetical protein